MSRIKSLPDNLIVGASLDLVSTEITSLPDNLTVGTRIRSFSISDIQKNTVRKLRNGDYVENRYLYADNILTHVKRCKNIGGYTVYIGKIPGKNVVSDGTHYAHCNKIRDGIADLLFKVAESRGVEQYKGMSLNTELTVEEAVTMYRIITGACRQGSDSFVKSLGELKEKYTIQECIEITKGQYNAKIFEEFFK